MIIIASSPIGNLKDISQRFKEAVENADILACEDTRVTKKLLALLKIRSSAKLISFNDINEKTKTDFLLKEAKTKNIVLISDAGTPLISDPGGYFIQKAYDVGAKISVAPGASAVVSALVLSGFGGNKFVFEGFYNNGCLIDIETEKRTAVYFVACHDLKECVFEAYNSFGPARRGAIVKEITKLNEKVIRGSFEYLKSFVNNADNQFFKGEFCLVVEGALLKANDFNYRQALKDIEKLIELGVSLKGACGFVANKSGASKNKLYSMALKHKDG